MKGTRFTPAALTLAVAVSAGAIAVGASQTPPPSSGAPAQREPAGRESQPSDAREFITKLTMVGMTEVQLGKIAEERATNPDVKAFGSMMVKDHTAAGEGLSKIAAQLNVPQPKELDGQHRQLVDRLSKLQGAEFDREYINAMVKGHEEVVSTLQARAGKRLTSNDPAAGGKPATGGSESVGTTGAGSANAVLTNWAAKTLPTTQKHLERARAIQATLK